MSFWDSFLAGLTAPIGTTGVKSPWQPSGHLAPVVLSDVLPGLDTDAIGMNRSAALQVPAVSRCQRILLGAASSAKLLAVSESGDLSAGDTPQIVLQPCPGEPAVVTLTRTIDQLIWYGVAYWHVTHRDEIGRPTAIRRLDATTVSWTPATPDVYTVGSERIRYSDVLRFDGVQDPVLITASEAIRRARDIERAASNAERNPVPSIELHLLSDTPSAEERRALVQAWADARKGKNGGVALSTKNVEVKTHGQAAEQLLIEGRQEAVRQIARAFGMPVWAVDASVPGSSMTYSNVESRTREILDYTLQPHLSAIASRLSMDDVLPAGIWARWDVWPLIRGDLGTRMTAYKTGIEAGVLTPEEVRVIESDRRAEETK